MTTVNVSRPSEAVEGDAPVTGGTLRYRLAGNASAPCVVFENGWGASFPYALWLERALAPHLRLLCYDRVGIGESRRTAPPTVTDFTLQLHALLAHLKIEPPVIVAGHSYGGLMAALHAVQAPGAVRAIVQIDATPELADPQIDRQLELVPLLGRFAQLCALLRVRDPVFSILADDLPPEVAQRLLRNSLGRVASMSASLDELELFPAIRAAIAAGGGAPRCPRLVISAGATRPPGSLVGRLMGGAAAGRRVVEVMQGLHRRQAAFCGSSRWESLPFDHGGLIVNPAGATALAERIRAFVG